MAQSFREVHPEEIEMDSLYFADGGFSEVYRAYWRSTEKKNEILAIKKFRGTHLHSAEKLARDKERLRRETSAWLHAQSHSNILPFIGIYYIRKVDFPCLVSPYRPDGNILDYLDKDPYANRLELVIGVMKGMVHLHHWSIVHGDLTPKNVLIHRHKGSVLPQISDFGRAKILDERGFTGSLNPSYRYTAPEVLFVDSQELVAEGVPDTRNRVLTHKSDVYSLGMVVLEILSGTQPFPRQSNVQVIRIHDLGGTPNIDDHGGTQSMGWIWSLLQDCWKFGDEPSSRCSAKECLTLLQGLTPVNSLN